MKPKTLLMSIALSLFLLAGCGLGGDGDDQEDMSCQVDQDCTTDGSCDDCNACTNDICSGVFQVCRSECNAAGPADPCCDNPACNRDPNCAFPGGTFSLHIEEINQQPANCVIPQLLLDLILPIVRGTAYPVVLPPEEGYPTNINLPIPLFGPIELYAQMVGGELVFDPIEIQDIDLSTFNIPGLNCIVGGTAEGTTEGLSPDAFEVVIDISDMSVAQGNGIGPCTLNQPAPECTLTVTSDGEAAQG